MYLNSIILICVTLVHMGYGNPTTCPNPDYGTPGNMPYGTDGGLALDELFMEIGSGWVCEDGEYLLAVDGLFDKCVRKCQQRTTCAGFTWSPDPYGLKAQCQLRTHRVCRQSDPGASSYPDAVLYERVNYCPEEPYVRPTVPNPNVPVADMVVPTGFTLIHANANCPDGALRTINVDQKTCARKCRNIEECVGYVFFFEDSNKVSCVLKQAVMCPTVTNKDKAYVFQYDTCDPPNRCEDPNTCPGHYGRWRRNWTGCGAGLMCLQPRGMINPNNWAPCDPIAE